MKKVIITLLLFLLIGGSIFFLYYKKNDTPNEVDNKYNSKTLEKIKENDLYDEKFLNEYNDITYNDNKNFLEDITLFLNKGYTGKEINNIYLLSENNKSKLKDNNYIDISKYYKFKNYDVLKTASYDEFSKKNNYELKDIVTYVNINLDKSPYTNAKEIVDGEDYLVLVNKYNYLTKSFVPSDLVNTKGFYGSVSLRKNANDALNKFLEEGKKNNVNLLPTTAYRSFDFQNTLYTNYVNKDGVKAADTYSARPGYSEHQTGLAIDLKNPSLKDERLTESDYTWLKANCSDYGFILRFPKGKEFITGYQEENWHIRYVGVDNAKKIMKENLTLEEYIDLYITEY
ncbi:MAG: M15 family metallopeptidase [Bacilli bacterium]